MRNSKKFQLVVKSSLMVENKIIFETENVFRSKLCKSNSNSAWNELAFPVFTLTYLYGIYV